MKRNSKNTYELVGYVYQTNEFTVITRDAG